MNWVRLAYAGAHAARLSSRIAWRARRVQKLVVHAHFLNRPADVVRLAALPRRARRSVTVHAGDATGDSVFTRRWRADGFDVVIAASEFVSQRLDALGVRSVVVRCGVEVPPETVPPRDAPKGKVAACTVARLIESKGMPDAATVLEYLASEVDMPIEWTIVGDGPVAKWLDSRGAALADRRVSLRLLGALSHSEALKEIAKQDLFILASRVDAGAGYGDGIPVALMEAMTRGILTVATAAGGIPELILDDQTGIVINSTRPQESARHIGAVLLDQPKLSAISAKAQRHIADHYSQERNFERMLAILREQPIDFT